MSLHIPSHCGCFNLIKEEKIFFLPSNTRMILSKLNLFQIENLRFERIVNQIRI